MKRTIIAISRQYGSGGRTIGRKVAERLSIPFVDGNTAIPDFHEREGVLNGDLRGILRVYLGEFPGPAGEFRCIVMRDGDPEEDLRMYAEELAEWVDSL